MSEKADITLEDVETAIRVLNAFMRRTRQAEMTLRRFQRAERGASAYGFSMEKIVEAVMQQAKGRVQVKEEPIPEPTETDLERMREIARTHKKGVTA